jgi:hypothetical protein
MSISAISNATIATQTQVLPKSNSSWREVVVSEKDENGNVLKNKDGNPIETTYIEDAKTGDLYVNDDRFVVAVKSAMAFAATPILAAGVMVWNIGKIFFDIVRISFNVLQNFGTWWKEKGLFHIVKEFFGRIFKAVICQDLWHIVRAPFYAIGMMMAAGIGVICPYFGRKWVAKIENSWQDGFSHERDIRVAGEKESLTLCPVIWKESKEARVFYLAHCFQVQGNIHKPNILILNYK